MALSDIATLFGGAVVAYFVVLFLIHKFFEKFFKMLLIMFSIAVAVFLGYLVYKGI